MDKTEGEAADLSENFIAEFDGGAQSALTVGDIYRYGKRTRMRKFSPEKLPSGGVAIFVGKIDAGVDVGMTFGIWQGMVAARVGFPPTREQFDIAYRKWERDPTSLPMMTIAVDADEFMSQSIADIHKAA